MSATETTSGVRTVNLSNRQVQLLVRGIYALRSKINGEARKEPEVLEELTEVNNLLLENYSELTAPLGH